MADDKNDGIPSDPELEIPELERPKRFKRQSTRKTPVKRNHKSGRGFTKTYQGGPPAHGEAVMRAKKRAEICERQQKSWELFVAGATFKQIGEALGVSNKTAWCDCRAVLDRLESDVSITAESLVRRQLSRLDAIHRAHYPNRKDPESAGILLSISRREAQLMGLDKKRDDVIPVDQVMSFVRNITSLFMNIVADQEKRRAFVQGLRQQMGPMTVIDVKKVTDGRKTGNDDDDDPEGGSGGSGGSGESGAVDARIDKGFGGDSTSEST